LFTVKNIYFDNDDDLLIRRSIDKPYYKEKLRLRGYDNFEDDGLFFEIKKKCNKIVYKRRVKLQFEQLESDYSIKKLDNQIAKELDFFIKRYHPIPKYYIGYKRQAFKGKDDPSLRITFDSDITYRSYDLDLRSGSYGKKLLQEDEFIMEIKTNSAMPLWLVETLNHLKIYPTSFSKVGNVYKKEYTESRGIHV